MNRKFISTLSVLLLGSYLLSAQEEPNAADYLLIDFANLAPGYQPADGEPYQRQVDPLPIAEDSDTTIVRFTNTGASLTPEADASMSDSLALDRWQINFSPSARWHNTIVNSYVMSYKMRESASMYAGENVLAARLYFSQGQFNTHASIHPPFVIPSYASSPEGVAPNELNTTEDRWGQFLHRGVLRNVGNIRSISTWIYGRNSQLSLNLILDSSREGTLEIPLGNLDFLGWRKLTWVNPAYIQDVRKRENISNQVYPSAIPSLVFNSFKITRDYTVAGGEASNAVFYAKSVYVIFDKASNQAMTQDINDEDIWQLLAEQAREQRRVEDKRASQRLENDYYLMQNRVPFPPGGTSDAAAPAQVGGGQAEQVGGGQAEQAAATP